MSSALLSEIRCLRWDLADLASRVLALEEKLSGSERVVSSPVTVNYSVAPGSYPPVAPLPNLHQESPAVTAASGTSAAASNCTTPVRGGLASDYTEAERRRVAEETGAFLRRSLAGVHRGESGRDQIKLQSRVYILCRDLHGRVYNPVQVHRSFSTLRPLVKEGGQCGDSIFIGVPTIWEAKVSVAAAGLSWPADD